jgi:hypothetical protein
MRLPFEPDEGQSAVLAAIVASERNDKPAKDRANIGCFSMPIGEDCKQGE